MSSKKPARPTPKPTPLSQRQSLFNRDIKRGKQAAQIAEKMAEQDRQARMKQDRVQQALKSHDDILDAFDMHLSKQAYVKADEIERIVRLAVETAVSETFRLLAAAGSRSLRNRLWSVLRRIERKPPKEKVAQRIAETAEKLTAAIMENLPGLEIASEPVMVEADVRRSIDQKLEKAEQARTDYIKSFIGKTREEIIEILREYEKQNPMTRLVEGQGTPEERKQAAKALEEAKEASFGKMADQIMVDTKKFEAAQEQKN
jgi:hypothetical protein